MMDVETTRRVRNEFDRARWALRKVGGQGDGRTLVKQFNEALADFETQARKRGFDSGYQLAARVEQRATREAVGQLVLQTLGKDAGDGVIDLGALGRWRAGSERFPGAREVE